MTDPDQKPVISDAEVETFREACLDSAYSRGANPSPEKMEYAIREALYAFLVARVPAAKEVKFHPRGMEPLLSGGEWNACRDVVLKGRGG